MTEKHGRMYTVIAVRDGEEKKFSVRGGGKGIKLVEQLEADGWQILKIQHLREDKRQVTRRRNYKDED